MPNWEAIRREWETSEVTFKELAEKHGVKDSTVRSRKNREKWQRNATKDNATQRKNVATKIDSVATPKKKASSPKERYEPIVESEELTDKQRLFCIYYVKSFNATQSAIKAGYSKDTAHVQGPRLLGNVRVAAEIRRIKEEMTSELFISASDVLNKYIKIAFADITDYVEFGYKEVTKKEVVGFDDEGKPIINKDTDSFNYVDLKDSSEVDGTIITEVKQGRDGVSIKLEDRMRALDMLAKYFDILPDGIKQRVEIERAKATIEKTKAETEFTQERTKRLKGQKKDTGLLEALIEGRKQYEQNKD